MKVKRNTLLLLACAGVGRSGCQHPPDRSAGLSRLTSPCWNYPAVGTGVSRCSRQAVFGKLVKKHTARIGAYGEERLFFLRFFDRKSPSRSWL